MNAVAEKLLAELVDEAVALGHLTRIERQPRGIQAQSSSRPA
jgi:hypothetical protein